METLLKDVRYGVRMLLKRPAFTAIAVVTLALGIGANTAIFSVVNSILLRPLPYKNPERIMRVGEHHAGLQSTNITYASFLDLLASSKSLEAVSAYRNWNYNLTDAGEPEQAQGALVSGNFFSALGVAPALGRSLLAEDDQPGSNNVVVISHGLWQRRFAADANVIGKIIKVNNASYTIIAVLPRGFDFPNRSELWTPLVANGSLRTNRRAHLLTVIARLKQDTTIEQAQSELAAISGQIQEQNSGADPDFTFSAASLHEQLVAPVRPALLVMFGAVGLVLLIACMNVANLLLARASTREKEMAIRAALGAGHIRLIRQLMTESLMLALIGGLLGTLLARWSVGLIIAFSPSNIPRLDEVSIDGRVLAFTLLASLFTGLLFGLAPALQSSKVDLNESLKEGGRSSLSAGRHRLRSALVISEIALALVLLVGAGLLINSFKRLLDTNPGFNSKNLLTMQLFLSPSRYTERDQKTSAFLQQALERIRTVPGIQYAGLVNTLPITGGPSTSFEIAGQPAFEIGDEPSADIRVVDPDYFRAMEIPLLKGRWFTERDSATSTKVMVINETMARRFFPDEDPMGKQVTMKDWGDPLTGEIIGVVKDVKAGGLDSDDDSMIYWPYTQFPGIFNRVVVRTASDPSSMVAAIKNQVWSVDSEQPIADIKTMEQVLSTSVAQRRFNMALIGSFAFIALALAAVGIYGIVSYTVAERTREIGIRMALGAERRDIIKLVMKQAVSLTLIGLIIGLAGAFAISRALSSLLFKVSATDPATFAIISLILAGVALGASFVPARRATKVDPMVALRYE
ncbi:MAG TPA: ABC transporter permease [Blastocatellia bacterium]|nr:ABC transporter permease [Blastocatellia bacterium]